MVISVPQTTLSKVSAQQPVNNTAQKVLFIGQMTSGTATAGTLTSNIQLGQGEGLFGSGSMLAGMIRDAQAINPLSQFDAIPLADAGGATAATATIVLTGATISGSGTLVIEVGSKINHAYSIPVTAGTLNGSNLSAAITAAVNADTFCPVTASGTSGTVTLTVNNKGPEGNALSIGVRGASSITGLTVTVNGMSGGATAPTLTNIFNAIGDTRYQTIVFPASYGYTFASTFLDGRFNVNNNILDGVAITSKTDTYANLITALNALNSKSLAIHCNNIVNTAYYKSSAIMELDYSIASQFAALRALRLTQGADISSYVISSNGGLDSFGGPAIASLPYHNTPFYNLPLIVGNDGFTNSQGTPEINNLLAAGGFCLGNNRAGTQVICGDVVTTYKTNASGAPDVTFGNLEFVDTISQATEYIWNNLKSDYAQCRLTQGDCVAGRVMANPVKIITSLVNYYATLAGPQYVLVQGGQAAIAFFKQNLTLAINMAAGSVTFVEQLPIVTQIRSILGTIQAVFNVTT